MKLSNSKFNEMSFDEMQEVDGGGWVAFVAVCALILGTMVVVKGCSDADHGK